MAISFKKAVKHESFLRMAIAGPSGSGKTFTALKLAHTLAGNKPVAVIDTERGSASKYADMFPEFDVVDLENFNPNNYIEAIQQAERSGYGIVVIDSLSHAWNGPGGLLEMVENLAKRGNKSTFNAWGEATPLQNKLIDTITRSRLHIICTMRTKTEYVVEPNEKGKSAPRKVGTSPIQRADIEYEFDVYADMDADNTMIVHKSRCPQLSGAVISKPDSHVADLLLEWLRGVPVPAQPERPVAVRPAVPVGNNAPDDLANIPSASQLRQALKDLNIEWQTALEKTFEHYIKEGKTSIQALLNAGDELPPNYCKRIAAYLQSVNTAA